MCANYKEPESNKEPEEIVNGITDIVNIVCEESPAIRLV